MAIPGYTLTEIQDTDTFKQWADKCKDIQTALNNTQFITSTSGVTVDTAQSITGVKTFDAPLLASDSITVNSPNKSFTISGNGNFNVSKNVFFTSDFNSSGETTLTATTSAPLRLINGGQGSSLAVDSSGDLDVSSELTAQKLISDTSLSVTSDAFVGGDANIVGSLEVDSDQITVNSLTYTWPSTAPTGISYLKNENGVFEWENETDHNLAAVSAAISQLGETNFTLPIEVVPITTVTEADTSILSQFTDNGDGTYGTSTTLLTWRVCDGSTVSFSPSDERYKELCLALNETLVPSDTSGSATLPDLRLGSQPYTVEDFLHISTDTTADVGDWQTTDGIESGLWNVEASWGKNYVDSTFKSFGTHQIDQNEGFEQYSFYISQDNQLYASGYSSQAFVPGDGYLKGFQPIPIPFADEDEYVEDFALGSLHSNSTIYVISNKGRLYGSGHNQQGNLGVGDTTDRSNFIRIGTFENIKQFSAGQGGGGASHCLLIDDQDQLWSWGHNAQGQCGRGGTTDKLTPGIVNTTFLNGAIPVKVTSQMGWGSSYLIDSNGDLYTCGENGSGALGLGNNLNTPSFTKVSTLSNVKDVYVSSDASNLGSSYVILDNGDLYSAGYNYYGQLGVGDTANRNTFTQVNLDGRAVTSITIFHGGDSKVDVGVILGDKTIRTWGHNASGQLGVGNQSQMNSPQLPVGNPQNVVKLKGRGYTYGCLYLLNEDGEIFSCGYGGSGQLGYGGASGAVTSFVKVGIGFKDFEAYGYQQYGSFMGISEDNEILTCGYAHDFMTGTVHYGGASELYPNPPTILGSGGLFGNSNTSIAKRYEVPEGEYLYFGVKGKEQYQAITTSATAPAEGDSDWVLLDNTLIASDEGIVVDEETSYIKGNATKLVNAYGQDGSTIKIIKAEKDQTANFAVVGGDGISITAVGPNSANLVNSFDIYGTTSLKLDVNTFDFNFVNRKLQIKAVEFGALDEATGNNQKTVVRRDSFGCTYMNDPVYNRHVTNKRWVESKIQELTDGTIQQLRDETEENFSRDRGSIRAFHVDMNSSDRVNNSHKTPYPTGFAYSFNFINREGDPGFMGTIRWSHADKTRDYYPTGGTTTGSSHVGFPSSVRFRSKNWEASEEYGSRVKEVIPMTTMGSIYIDYDNYVYAVGYDWKGFLYTGPDTTYVGYGGLVRKYPTICLDANDQPFQVDWMSINSAGVHTNNYTYTTCYYKVKDANGVYGDILCAGYNGQGALGRSNTTDSAKGQKPTRMGDVSAQCAQMMWMYFSERGGDWNPSTGNNDGTDDLSAYFHNQISATDQWNIMTVQAGLGNAFAIVRKGDNKQGHVWAAGGGYKGIGDDQSRSTISNWVPVIKNSGGVTITPSAWNDGVYTTSTPHGIEEFDTIKRGTGWWRARLGDLNGNNKDVKFRLYNDSDADTKKCIIGGASGLYKNSDITSVTFVRKKRLTNIKKICFVGHQWGYQNVIALDGAGKVWGWGRNRDGAGLGRNALSNVANLAENNSAGGFVNEDIDDIFGSDGDVSFCTKTVQVGGLPRTDIFSCGQAEEGVLGHGSTTADIKLFTKLGYMTEDIGHSVHRVFCTTGWAYDKGNHRGCVFVVTKPIDGVGKSKLWAAGYNQDCRLGTPDYRDVDTAYFQDIMMPEDPLKIVEVQQNLYHTWLLFKDNSDDLTGRCYRAGSANEYNPGYEYSNTGTESQYFSKWDRRLDM